MITEDLKISDSILWIPVLHIPTSRNGELESQHTALQLLIFHNCTSCFAIARLPQLHQLLCNCSSSTIALFAPELLVFYDCLSSTIALFALKIVYIPQLHYSLVYFVTIELYFFKWTLQLFVFAQQNHFFIQTTPFLHRTHFYRIQYLLHLSCYST